MGQRLLAVDMQSGPKSRERCEGVHVVRRGHDHGVDALPIEDAAKIGVVRCLRISFPRIDRAIFVNVAQSDDLSPCFRHLCHVVIALAVDANDGDVEAFVR